MRKIILMLCLLASQPAFSDSIKKWTDTAGNIHYGDAPPPENSLDKQVIELHNSFDQAAYDAAMKRNLALYKQIKQIEKEELIRTKDAEDRLNDYFDSLNKKKREAERNKASKQRSRDRDRNRSSIKIKRSKQKSSSSTKKKKNAYQL